MLQTRMRFWTGHISHAVFMATDALKHNLSPRQALGQKEVAIE